MSDQGSGLVSIKRLDLFKEVVSSIDRYMESNHLQPGDRLPSDRYLATSLGVSRPLIRQALKVLEGLGRLEARQGSGTFVCEAGHRVAVRELTRDLTLDEDTLSHLLPLRVAIEVEVMRAAFSRRDDEMIATIRDVIEQRERQLEDDPQEAGLDLTFEAALGTVCGNELLRRFQALVHDLWLQSQLSMGRTPEDRFHLHREHVAIFDAFTGGDLEEALRRFEGHLRELPGS